MNLGSTSGAQEQVRSPSSAPDPGTSDGLHHCRCGQLTHRIGQAKHLMKLVTASVLGACLLFVGGCGVFDDGGEHPWRGYALNKRTSVTSSGSQATRRTEIESKTCAMESQTRP